MKKEILTEKNLKGKIIKGFKIGEFMYTKGGAKYFNCKCEYCGKNTKVNIYRLTSNRIQVDGCGCRRMEETMEQRLEKYIDYIEEKKNRIMELEKELSEIKKNPKWISAKSYLSSMKCKGIIDEVPTKENNYRKPQILI